MTETQAEIQAAGERVRVAFTEIRDQVGDDRLFLAVAASVMGRMLGEFHLTRHSTATQATIDVAEWLQIAGCRALAVAMPQRPRVPFAPGPVSPQ